MIIYESSGAREKAIAPVLLMPAETLFCMLLLWWRKL
jgi:hypothetical protein